MPDPKPTKPATVEPAKPATTPTPPTPEPNRVAALEQQVEDLKAQLAAKSSEPPPARPWWQGAGASLTAGATDPKTVQPMDDMPDEDVDRMMGHPRGTTAAKRAAAALPTGHTRPPIRDLTDEELRAIMGPMAGPGSKATTGGCPACGTPHAGPAYGPMCFHTAVRPHAAVPMATDPPEYGGGIG